MYSCRFMANESIEINNFNY